jgi:hypothetical protein
VLRWLPYCGNYLWQGGKLKHSLSSALTISAALAVWYLFISLFYLVVWDGGGFVKHSAFGSRPTSFFVSLRIGWITANTDAFSDNICCMVPVLCVF